jgi:hypothetical protein
MSILPNACKNENGGKWWKNEGILKTISAISNKELASL